MDEITVSASEPCRYCLGGAGAYGPWNPDAMGVTITGSFIFGIGIGMSFFAGDYLGDGQPSFNSYMGPGQSNSLNMGPFSFGQSADLSKPYNDSYRYGKNWETGSVGFGLYSSLLTGIGGSSQIGTSISLLHF